MGVAPARLLAAAPRRLTSLALAAAALGLILPWAGLARRSDLLLALLVLATALGISAGELRRLREHWAAVVALSLAPLAGLTAFAWALGHAFGGPVRDGLLACGLSSAEVASVGLVALAGADATIALGAVTGSLVAAAVLGPLGVAWIGGGHADGAALLGRFALVVLLPLVVGVLVRTAAPDRLGVRDEEREGVAALAVVALVYASLSGEHGAHHLGSALLASAAFLAGATLAALTYRRAALAARPGGAGGGGGGAGGRADGGGAGVATAGAFTIAMRDFAVAAALATEAFGPAAGVVPGVYGVLMLVGGSAAATALRRHDPVRPA